MGRYFSKCINREKRTMVFIGLSSSGKTSLVKSLRKDDASAEGATNLYEQVNIRKGGYNIEVFDLSGDQKHYIFWKFYTENCNLIIFVVDISNSENILKSKNVFEIFYTSYLIKKSEIIFVLNKKDLVPSESLDEIKREFIAEFSSVPGMEKEDLDKKIIVTSAMLKEKTLFPFICTMLK